ncbi:hypothetical protein M758_11G018200 [Ceratodon purpureus]|nr:hypothetical protein M758_11G018200 [Ceratodon purpureus]
MTSTKIMLVLVLFLLAIQTPAIALIVNTTLSDCSSTCESQHCSDPLKLRYGKYCGIGYSGCEGQAPCDGIDSCCLTHDNCIGSNLQNYVNQTCNNALKNCVEQFKTANLPQFSGSNCSATEVEGVIVVSMDAATIVGNSAAHKSPLFNFQALFTILCSILVLEWH